LIGSLIDDFLRSLEDARDGAAEALFEPTLRLGVTGLSRAGKTVFITSLVAHLLERGRLAGFEAQAEGRLEAVMLRPQPDREVPRFDYETHRAALSGAEPFWPESTRAISQLRLSLRFRGGGVIGGLWGPRTLHLDIVDYPGEWLLDLPLIGRSYAEWSHRVLEQARMPTRAPRAAAWLEMLEAARPEAEYDEAQARALTDAYVQHLAACRADGLSGVSPGRFLMPGDLEGSPALTFTPLPPGPARRGSLRAEFEERYDSYVRRVAKPFFRDHFARIERQVVLVDLLSALDAGPGAVADLRDAMAEILRSFRPGENSWLSAILGKRVDRILFAAAKADHIHHTQHGRMTGLLEALLRESVSRARFSGAKTRAVALASLRSTVEQEVEKDGRKLPCVRGRLLATGREAALFPGDLPQDPERVLAEAREDVDRGEGWLGGDLRFMAFAPPRGTGRAGEGPPHIRLDQAIEFLIGDRLE
jgi:predicted YcjX-like family ATPase